METSWCYDGFWDLRAECGGSHGAETIEEDFLRTPVCEHTIDFPACPLVYRPLCGTDGNTYDNECLLCITRTKNKQNIQILKDGPC
ncbi:serine protease inhibitor Kazal-type 4 [Alligator mississippiensis]|uniref:Serine protease inhibitor Kazal-type 4 n=1 Tax=Alligator mississippiensis TaxID=8496 RepID=A0A151NE63_ALLMI|nr:serine protease inhibitor Kazal-type 4 [Alligator mississippiensis]